MAQSDHQARTEKILDAAAELFVYYGYDKTTVSDIARAAGISKGAIYLHFESKDQLFEELFLREMQAYAETWLDLLDADPMGGTISAMYKNSLYALNDNPFMAAMLKRDKHVFGNYLRKPDNFMRNSMNQSTRHEFVTLMQEAGAIRQDLDARVIAHVMNMLSYGLVAMDEVMNPENIPPTENIIEGIAALMQAALAPADGGNSEAGRAIIDQIANAARQEFEAKRSGKEE